MTTVGWLLVIWTHQGFALTLPTQFPSESVCIASAKAAHVQMNYGSPSKGLGAFICIPGHSPLHGGKETGR